MNKATKEYVISKALALINRKVKISIIPKVIVKKDLIYTQGVEGFYHTRYNKIYLQDSDNYERVVWVLVHEIGHFIHWRYFKATNFNFQSYTYNNHMESFAEVFTDYIFATSALNGDLLRIDELLKSRVLK